MASLYPTVFPAWGLTSYSIREETGARLEAGPRAHARTLILPGGLVILAPSCPCPTRYRKWKQSLPEELCPFSQQSSTSQNTEHLRYYQLLENVRTVEIWPALHR